MPGISGVQRNTCVPLASASDSLRMSSSSKCLACSAFAALRPRTCNVNLPPPDGCMFEYVSRSMIVSLHIWPARVS
eukprot:6210032-Pleurochrysis_carterae.AAC.7